MDENWIIEENRLQFDFYPVITNFDVSAYSPVITLDADVREIGINQHIETYEFGYTDEIAEISIISDTSETILWTYDLSAGNWGWASGTDLNFNIAEFSGQDVQFRFRTYGTSTSAWFWWDIFSMKLIADYDKDLSINSIGGSANIVPNQPATFTVEITNLGHESQTGFMIELISLKTGNVVGDMQVSSQLPPGLTDYFSIDWTPTGAHNTALYAKVILPGDKYEENNEYRSHFLRVRPDVTYSVLIWDNDNGIDNILDPEKGDVIQASLAMVRAFDGAGIPYELLANLPEDLSVYDMIFTTMGCYCLG